MTSEKQAQANRRNAQKSTGPKTPEGKTAVRHNALKHGLLAEDVLLAGEDEDALRDLEGRLEAELKPVGELESMLVEQIVAYCWRLRRLRRVEVGVFDWELVDARPYAHHGNHRGASENALLGRSFIRDAELANAFSKLSRYEIPIERSFYKALRELQRLQAARRAGENVPPPVAVDVDVSGVPAEGS